MKSTIIDAPKQYQQSNFQKTDLNKTLEHFSDILPRKSRFVARKPRSTRHSRSLDKSPDFRRTSQADNRQNSDRHSSLSFMIKQILSRSHMSPFRKTQSTSSSYKICLVYFLTRSFQHVIPLHPRDIKSFSHTWENKFLLCQIFHCILLWLRKLIILIAPKKTGTSQFFQKIMSFYPEAELTSRYKLNSDIDSIWYCSSSNSLLKRCVWTFKTLPEYPMKPEKL